METVDDEVLAFYVTGFPEAAQQRVHVGAVRPGRLDVEHADSIDLRGLRGCSANNRAVQDSRNRKQAATTIQLVLPKQNGFS